MDPFGSPYIIRNNRPQNPFPHSLLRTREKMARKSPVRFWRCHSASNSRARPAKEGNTQRLQYPLIKEYTFNYNRSPDP